MNTNRKQAGLRTLILIALVGLIMFGGVSITSVAAKSSLPGDMLYPVKTTVEQARLSLAQDAGDRAQMKLAFAEERLVEVGGLIDDGRYREVGAAVLAFESAINGAILELETLAEVDPARAARLALEVTSALTRYAQTLSELAAVAPEAVRATVARALDSTRTAGSLELPSDDNSNANANEADDDANSNDDNSNDDNGNINDNGNENANDDDDENGNDNLNSNDDDDNANDDHGNANDDDSNDDDHNGNANDDDDDGNSNSDDDNQNVNNNDDDDDDDDGGNSGSSGSGSGDDDNNNDNDNNDDHGGDDGGGDDDNDSGKKGDDNGDD